MSLNHVPSKVEVVGWNPQSLAGYMKKLKLSGCDKTVLRSGISGAQFMKMTERDLQVFSALHIPMITKIQSEINKEGQRKTSGHKSKTPSKQAFVQEEVWDSDEFDNDSDNNYESPDQEEDDDNYICALTEPETVEEQDSDESCEETYEVSPPTDKKKQPRPLRAARPQGRHHRDPVHLPPAVERTSKAATFPCPPRMTPSPQRPPKTPASQPLLQVDRTTKPGQKDPSQKDLPKPKGGPVKALSASFRKLPQPWTLKPKDVSNRAIKPVPFSPKPSQPAPVNKSKREAKQGLDPSWYVGNMTRHQAEITLREMSKDGAFLVRDSSKALAEHPHTLMLLMQGKVFNVKIRRQSDSYILGTGSNTKSFPGVKEMITHHTHTPLMLIDAADRSSEAQIQCCLLHPAGL